MSAINGLLDRIVRLQARARPQRSSPPATSRRPPAADSTEAAIERPDGFRERGRMRRRARYLTRLRKLQLRDLGGFVLELHRFGRDRPDLVRAKAEAAAATDRELRTLERALDEGRRITEVREPGIGGACPSCGSVHGSVDRYCSWCGRKL